MGWLADYLFKIGYYPIEHQSVKRDFLQWYFQAACDELVVEGLQADNSRLVQLTLEAAQRAEKIDSENPAIELLDAVNEYISRMKAGLAYLAVALFFVGCSAIAISVYTIDGTLLRMIGVSIGSMLGIPVAILSALYMIMEHQIRTNAELVSKFNRELVERPGQVRRNDRDWNRLAAQYLWNRSLGRPRTIIALLLLSIIKVARPGLYGTIFGELHDQIREFIGEDAGTIIKREIERALHGELGPNSAPSEPPPEPLHSPSRDEEYLG